MPSAPKPDRRRAAGKPASTYSRDVFINCPFDEAYRPMRDALVFAVFACNLRPRCALEASNSATTRIEKIVTIVRECRWGIHDISRTEANEEGLPRFNMPLELGLFIGAHRFGDSRQRTKSALVLDSEPFRFQKFISDIAGQDIVAHGNQPSRAIEAVRDWLASELQGQAPRLAGGAALARHFATFQRELPAICRAADRDAARLIYPDYCEAVSEWLIDTAPGQEGA